MWFSRKESLPSLDGPMKLFTFCLTRFSPVSLHENEVLYTHLDWVKTEANSRSVERDTLFIF